MARREHLLTTSISVDDPMGNSINYDLVRIINMEHFPPQKKLNVLWELGRDNDGQWDTIGSKHRGTKGYIADDYDTLHALASAGASEEYMAKIEDQIYQDLVSDSVIGTGTQQDYSF